MRQLRHGHGDRRSIADGKAGKAGSGGAPGSAHGPACVDPRALFLPPALSLPAPPRARAASRAAAQPLLIPRTRCAVLKQINEPLFPPIDPARRERSRALKAERVAAAEAAGPVTGATVYEPQPLHFKLPHGCVHFVHRKLLARLRFPLPTAANCRQLPRPLRPLLLLLPLVPPLRLPVLLLLRAPPAPSSASASGSSFPLNRRCTPQVLDARRLLRGRGLGRPGVRVLPRQHAGAGLRHRGRARQRLGQPHTLRRLPRLHGPVRQLRRWLGRE